jgi:hypothetical protein
VTKPTASQVWQQLLDEAGEDEIASVLSLTPEQVEAELAGHGIDTAAERAKADRFLDDLTASAASPLQAVLKPLPREITTPRRRPRTALVLLAAATTAAAAGALAYSALHHAPAPPESPPQPAPPAPPTTPAPPVVPDLVAAAQWRDKAVAACKGAQWEECLADLDRARALDAAGDDTPLVKSTRDKAIRGMTSKPK